MTQKRTENDVIGHVEVPADAYFGSFTARAHENFQISGITAPNELRIALGFIKKAAAQTNMELGEFEEKYARAIIKASDEFINGKFNDHFTLDVFQAGAGTPFNMNTNEIIANRANELLGVKKGKYLPITPHNHVNWGQSSNDVLPTAIRIAALLKLKDLLAEIDQLSKSLSLKAAKFKDILKIGRTHLQDAVPISLGQEFQAYASAISRSHSYINETFAHLLEVHIGGTAIGTGITTHPKYRPLIVSNLKKLTGLKLKATKYPTELNHNMNAFSVASNGLKALANDLIRISGDFTLLASGPAGGLNEINLPDVEPGSSIMPGKVNPSIAECVTMVGYQIIGNDLTINLAVQNSQLELNVNTPVIMHNLLWSIALLTNACNMFRTKCVDQITVNKKDCSTLLNRSLCLATGLSPYLGYKVTAELVKEAYKNNHSLYEVVSKKRFMEDKYLNQVLSAKKLISPATKDKALIKKIKNNQNYQTYCRKIGI